MAKLKNKKPVALFYDGLLWEVDGVIEVADEKVHEIEFLQSEGHELVEGE